MQEQALRSNTLVDQEFTKFVEPKDANIKISITTDTRISGTNRLAFLIGELLKREGYTNVAPFQSNDNRHSQNDAELDFILDQQKNVRITIEDPLNKTIKAIKDLDIEGTPCAFEYIPKAAAVESEQLKSV